jgi:hypothetical protein
MNFLHLKLAIVFEITVIFVDTQYDEQNKCNII